MLQVGQHLHNTDRKPVNLYEPVPLANLQILEWNNQSISNIISSLEWKSYKYESCVSSQVFPKHFDLFLDAIKRLLLGNKTIIFMKSLSKLRTEWAELYADLIEALCPRVWTLQPGAGSIPLWKRVSIQYFVAYPHIIFFAIICS